MVSNNNSKNVNSLSAVVDVEKLQSIMNDFHELTGMTTAILDMEGNIIEATGWQDICTKFHRIHPETAQNCADSDFHLVQDLKPGEYREYQCKNGLWDVVTPLYIEDRHMGNIYTGQFFYNDDVVDKTRFIKQAEKYGFDKEEYMAAFDRVPRYSRKEIKHLMQFLVKFTSYISSVSYAKQKLDKEVGERKLAQRDLAEQKNRLDYILQGTNAGTWEWNIQTGEMIINEQWANIIGYSLDEITPFSIKTWNEFCHPVDEKESSRLLQLCFDKTSQYYEYACRMRHKKGHWVWVLDRGKVITWTDDGKPEWMFGTHQDITRQKQAEEALRFTQYVVDETTDQAFWMTRDCKFFYVNDAACRSLGYTREELLALSLPDIDPNASFEFFAEHWQALQKEKFIALEALHRAKDGREYPVEIRANFVVFDDVEYNCAFATDITERKRMEQSLKDGERFQRALLKTIPDLVWLKDENGVFITCNAIFERLLNAKEAQIIGKTDYDFVDKNSADKFRENDRRAIAEGKPRRNEEWLTFADNGERVLVETVKTPMMDEKGRCIGVLGIARDITERKRAEEEKTELRNQLQQAQKMESVGRLAGGVAHDFNNMLGVIIGYSELGIRQAPPESQLHKALQHIMTAAKRSADITRQLLAFARKQTVSPKELDINSTVKSMTGMLRRFIGEDIDLVWRAGKEVWPVKMDPGQIDQIMVNLCVNARDAIEDVGKVTIETGNVRMDETYCNHHYEFLPGEYVLLAVSDNGCGMKPEILQNIFEPFFTTKEAAKGTGLGLSTVYGIVKQNKGFINVYSEPGLGTTFKIYLPRHRKEEKTLPVEAPEQPVESGHETILVVEDEPIILEMTTLVLESLGYKVISAGTPGDAILQGKKHNGDIDLLLTDVIMPEMNGRDLARTIQDLHPNLKCLFMSGYTANVIAHHGVLDEGVNFIQKPFLRGELGSKIHEVLRKGKH